MLRALRRLLRPGGRIAYITIHVTPGLPAAARRRAHRSGPRAVATRSDQLRLLGSAGFTDLEHVDITDEFLATTRAWLREREAHTEELAAVEGADTLAERVRDGRLQLRATEDGLLRRGIFAGTRPPRSA